jgi:hypothetical protein
MTNTLAYCDTELIATVKRCIVWTSSLGREASGRKDKCRRLVSKKNYIKFVCL